MRAVKRVSALSLVVVVVIAALSVVAFGLTKRSVDSQNHALLETQAEQVTQLLQSAVSQVGTTLPTIEAVADATGSSASAFKAQVVTLTVMPNVTVAVVRSGRVVLASGHGLSIGQALPAPLADAVAHGGPKLFSTGVLRIGRQQVVAFIVGAGPTSTAVVEETVVQPSVTTPTAKGPYKQINIALYATATAQPDQLIVTTARPLPLPAPVAKTFLPIGTSKWLVVTAAKAPLAGRFPDASPYVLLAVGLLLALVMAYVVNVLIRRQRYTAELVAERTAELVASQEALVRGERLAAVGEMATIIGHELRNPLGAVTNAHYLVRQSLGDPTSAQRHLDMAERELSRAAHLAEDLTTYMRERAPVPVVLNLKDVVDEVLEACPPPPGVAVADDTTGITLTADRTQLAQILTNVVNNAYQAMHDQGSLRLAAAAENGTMVITAEDSGEGMDPVNADKVFEPFFTTKADGTGLGLAIVRRLAEGHGGSVSIENSPHGGAVVTVRIPLRPSTERVP